MPTETDPNTQDRVRSMPCSASLRVFCKQVVAELDALESERWAEVFVERRMDLQRQYLRGLVLSTTHGADVFTNILACLDGAEWEEKGELGNNFRALIRQAGRATQNDSKLSDRGARRDGCEGETKI